jgi:hypothetical protein
VEKCPLGYSDVSSEDAQHVEDSLLTFLERSLEANLSAITASTSTLPRLYEYLKGTSTRERSGSAAGCENKENSQDNVGTRTEAEDPYWSWNVIEINGQFDVTKQSHVS